MKRLAWMLAGLCASLSVGSVAQSAAQTVAQTKTALFTEKEMKFAAQLREDSLKNNISMTIVESLTTEIGPRLAGSEADARAVVWAENKMKSLGFDKVWKEPVSFPTWKRGLEKAEITAPYPQPLYITALGFSVATPAEGMTAEVVEFPTFKALTEASAEQVKGKIVFINHKMQNHTEYGWVVAGRGNGASEASRRGAVAIIIRSVGTDSHRFPHTGMTRYAKEITPIPAAAMSSPDADMLSRMLARGKPVSIKLQLTPSYGNDYTSHNVIGEITGSELPHEYVLMGGHLDSWDLGTGAIDDGAGCAITMAAAERIIHSIKQGAARPKRSIRVVLYANEEQGLIGGKAYYDAHASELNQIQAASEADSGQGPVTHFHSFVEPAALPVVAQIFKTLEPLHIQRGHNNAGPGPDMGVLRAAGVASFDLQLYGADYFDYHHTPDDTFDKIEAKRINQSTASYTVFAWMAAQSPIGFNSTSAHLKAAAKNPDRRESERKQQVGGKPIVAPVSIPAPIPLAVAQKPENKVMTQDNKHHH